MDVGKSGHQFVFVLEFHILKPPSSKIFGLFFPAQGEIVEVDLWDEKLVFARTYECAKDPERPVLSVPTKVSRNKVTESFWMVWWWLVGLIVWK